MSKGRFAADHGARQLVSGIWGDIGMVLFVPAAVAYLLMVGIGRAMACTRLAR